MEKIRNMGALPSDFGQFDQATFSHGESCSLAGVDDLGNSGALWNYWIHPPDDVEDNFDFWFLLCCVYTFCGTENSFFLDSGSNSVQRKFNECFASPCNNSDVLVPKLSYIGRHKQSQKPGEEQLSFSLFGTCSCLLFNHAVWASGSRIRTLDGWFCNMRVVYSQSRLSVDRAGSWAFPFWNFI